MNNTDLEKNIARIISELSDQKGYVSSIDVLLGLNYLSKTDLKKWRNRQVEYLEKIVQANLSKLTAVNQFIKQFAKKNEFGTFIDSLHKIR